MEDQSKIEILEAVGAIQEAIQALADHMDRRFEGVDKRFEAVEKDIRTVKNQMVTKSYLDDKLSDWRADLMRVCLKANTKLSTIVEELVKKGSMSRDMADRILAMEPFPS